MVGLLVALSLFWQYWGILSGTEPYDDRSMPLLNSAEQVRKVGQLCPAVVLSSTAIQHQQAINLMHPASAVATPGSSLLQPFALYSVGCLLLNSRLRHYRRPLSNAHIDRDRL